MAKLDHRRYSYQKVLDSRKQPIRGLWERNGVFVARLTVEDSETGRKSVQRVVLRGAQTKAQAVEELKRLQVERGKKELAATRLAPKFSVYASRYFAHHEAVRDKKRLSTLAKEKATIKLWSENLGHLRLDQIKLIHINSFMEKRQAAGRSGRTGNLDIIAFRNVMKLAVDDGLVKDLPTKNLRPLKSSPPKRGLVTGADIERVCAAALEVSKNGQEFADYMRFLAYSGARRSEALRLKWDQVDWTAKQVTIGADGLTKGREVRRVDFNDKLEAHLRDMSARRQPDSAYLFPSPVRGDKDASAKTFKESLGLARKKSGLGAITFHDCRHFFISMCVMSGIDFMTIARWVGHKDGGVLIGKVYGHLSNEHAQVQARRVQFGPAIVEAASA